MFRVVPNLYEILLMVTLISINYGISLLQEESRFPIPFAENVQSSADPGDGRQIVELVPRLDRHSAILRGCGSATAEESK